VGLDNGGLLGGKGSLFKGFIIQGCYYSRVLLFKGVIVQGHSVWKVLMSGHERALSQ